MNGLGRVVLNSPARALAQRRYVVPMMHQLGGSLQGSRVLEIGCGCGRGAELLLDVLHATEVEAMDIDPVMVRLASRRLAGRAAVTLGDMVEFAAPTHTFDAVVDMGAVHLEPRWRNALAEVHRVLKPGGRLFFEEIVRPRRQALATLATGQRPPLDFTRVALLDELEQLGFTVVGIHDIAAPALTGVVGDVIAVVSSGASAAAP